MAWFITTDEYGRETNGAEGLSNGQGWFKISLSQLFRGSSYVRFELPHPTALTAEGIAQPELLHNGLTYST